MEAYKRIQLSRKSGRPTGLDFVNHVVTDFFEMHGDRRFADDPAIVAGVGRLCGKPITVIAQEKGTR